jgi:SAM-dependent methyltransferase
MNENHAQVCTSPEWAQHIQADILPALTSGVDLGTQMLELGPGPGAATEWLRHKVARLTAVELDAAAAALLATRYAGTNVDIATGSAARLAYQDESFDSVGTFTMLHHVPTLALQNKILSEAFRVLRPDGVLIGSDSLASNDLHHFHVGDDYNPVDPASLLSRLQTLGFEKITVVVDEVLTFSARKPAARPQHDQDDLDAEGKPLSDTGTLRAAITGLIGLAATEEQALLASAPPAETGTPGRWAAAAVVAHNTEFRRQQLRRLEAIRASQTPPEFAEVDHASADLYRDLAARPADAAARDSWHTAGELIAATRSVAELDLLDPSRHRWLRGRQLWLQIIVRGFWHPAGHLGEYYLGHGLPDRAVALAENAVATAQYLRAPAPARGMASYNLACARAGAGLLDEAAAAVAEAVALNPDVRANAGRDKDLAAVRDSGRLAAILGA